MDVESPGGGVVSYQWQEGETDVPGFYLGRITVLWPDGPQAFPNSGYLVVYISPDVGYAESPPLYVGLEELKEQLSLQNKTYADLTILKALRASSRGIDIVTKSRFYVPDLSNPETRYYTPRQRLVLDTDFMVAVEAVSVDRDGDGAYEEAWADEDFLLEPLNATIDDRPWDRIVPRPGNTWGVFPRDVPGAVRVEGLFGWNSPPPGIVMATTLLAQRLLVRQRSAPLGVVSFGEGLAARIARSDPDVDEQLRPYVPTIAKP